MVRGSSALRGLAALARRALSLLAMIPLTRLGWLLAVLGCVVWAAGVRLGWIELLIIAAGVLLVPAVALLWVVRRRALIVDVELVRSRVVVGDQAVARVRARSLKRRVAGGRVEIPVGHGVAVFDVPPVAANDDWQDSFIVPTDRRAVITVGPARAVTADPLGAAQRDITTGDSTELFVHPLTVRLPQLSSGWQRDLEGQTTNDLSTSDVAFHTLREYVPGDDRRHIHWRSSAKIGTLMVRQFVDTRRSQIGIALPLHPSMWDDEATFELGIQIYGSLGRTALLDGQTVQAVAGVSAVPAHAGQSLLDGLSRLEMSARTPELEGFV